MQPQSADTPFPRTNTARYENAPSPDEGANPSDLMGQAKNAASNMADQVKQQASSRFSDQVSDAAGGLKTASETMHDLGHQLREKGQDPVAEYVDKAADQVQRVSSYLEDHDLRAIRSDVEQFARRQPAMFIGGAVGLGLLAARFLKSTPKSPEASVANAHPAWSSSMSSTAAPQSSTFARPPTPVTQSQSGMGRAPTGPSSAPTGPSSASPTWTQPPPSRSVPSGETPSPLTGNPSSTSPSVSPPSYRPSVGGEDADRRRSA